MELGWGRLLAGDSWRWQSSREKKCTLALWREGKDEEELERSW